MKKWLAVILSVMIVFTMVAVTGCKKEQTPEKDPPKITLSKKDDETVPFTKSYTVPTPTCRSMVDTKKFLDVTIKCYDNTGAEVAVQNNKFTPKKLGRHTLRYNATDLNNKKAKEVVFNVTFEDVGILVKSKATISAYARISDFKTFMVPNFDDILEASYEYKDIVDSSGFNISVQAKHYPVVGDVSVISPEDDKAYSVGEIKTVYTLTAKSDASVTTEYTLVTQVENVLVNEFISRREDVVATVSEIEDKDVKPQGTIVCLETPHTEIQYGGAYLVYGRSLFMSRIRNLADYNETLVVFNAYNPTDYRLKTIMSVYDNKTYGGVGSLAPYGNSYIIQPKQHFKFIVPLAHIDQKTFSKIDISIQGDLLPEEGAEYENYPANKLYILGYDFVKESDSGVRTDIKLLPEELAAASSNAQKLTLTLDSENSSVNYKSNSDTDVFMDLTKMDSEVVTNKFLNARNKYDNLLAVDVKNNAAEGGEAVKMWFRLGVGSNQPTGNAGYLNVLSIAPGKTQRVYLGAASRYDPIKNVDWTFLNLNTDKVCDLTISNLRILNFAAFNQLPTEKFKVQKKSDALIKDFAFVVANSNYTLPVFTDVYTSLTAVDSSAGVIYKLDTDGVRGEAIDQAGSIQNIAEGIYEIDYVVTEQVSNYSEIVTFRVVVGDLYAVNEKQGRVAEISEYDNFKVPAFETVFSCLAGETEGKKVSISVKYLENELDATPEVIDITSSDILTGKKGIYDIVYSVEFTDSTKNVEKTLRYYANAVFTEFSLWNQAQFGREVVEGKSVLKVTGTVSGQGIGLKEATNSKILKAIKDAGKNHVIQIKGKNLSNFDIDLQYNYNNGPMLVTLKANQDYTLTFYRDHMVTDFSTFGFDFKDAANSPCITIEDITIADVSNKIVDIFTDANADTQVDAGAGDGSQIALGQKVAAGFTLSSIVETSTGKVGAIETATYAEGKITFTVKSEGYFNISKIPGLEGINKYFLSSSRGANALIFDMDTSKTMWYSLGSVMGAGNEPNGFYDNFHYQKSASNKTILFYSYMLTKTQQQATEDWKYINFYFEPGTYTISNIRVINLANIA